MRTSKSLPPAQESASQNTPGTLSRQFRSAGKSCLLWGLVTLTGWMPLQGEEIPTSETKSNGQLLQSTVRELIDDVSEVAVELDVFMNRPKLVRGKVNVVRVAVSNPKIVKVEMIDSRDVQILGQMPGSTHITLWMGDPQHSRILQLLVQVKPEPVVTTRIGLPELQTALNEQFPLSGARLYPVGNKLIVRGIAADDAERLRIMKLLRKHLGDNVGEFESSDGSSSVTGTGAPGMIVNLLRTRGEQQVRLRMANAEVHLPAFRKVCTQFDIQFDQRITESGDSRKTIPGMATLNAAAFRTCLQNLQSQGMARLVDDSNLLTINGHSVFFPESKLKQLPQDHPYVYSVSHTVTEGAGLHLTPTLTGKDRFRLEVASAVVQTKRKQKEEILPLTQPHGTELKFGETLIIAGTQTRADSIILLLVTPELVTERDPEREPRLLPTVSTRDSKGIRRTSAVSVDLPSGAFFIQGPAGYSK